MSFGIKLMSSSGSLVYSSDDVTWNQVDFFMVGAGGSVTNDYPVLSGRSVLTAQTFINPPPTNQRAIAHTIDVSGTTVSVYGGSEAVYVIILMR